MDFKSMLDCPKNKTNFCPTCRNYFMSLRTSIKDVIISKHFSRDLKDEETINSLIKSILDCSHLEFVELHKFEENIDGNIIFRARKENLHIVYCVDKKMRIIFLRAIRNFDEYKRFIDNKKEIKMMIERSNL